MRHAEAEWAASSDFERPLSDRGERDATAVGQLLRQHPHPPQKIVASAAYRTKMTAERVAAELTPPGVSIQLSSRFYGASLERWIEAIVQTDPSIASLLVVGHNPTISRLVEYVAGLSVALHPASYVDVELELDWDAVGQGTGSARGVVQP
jgi:phosphohistidine phosphatase